MSNYRSTSTDLLRISTAFDSFNSLTDIISHHSAKFFIQLDNPTTATTATTTTTTSVDDDDVHENISGGFFAGMLGVSSYVIYVTLLNHQLLRLLAARWRWSGASQLAPDALCL